MIELLRYFVVSVLALVVDMSILLLASQYIHYLWAATLGFVAGAVISYILSVNWAFRQRRLVATPRTEFIAYVLIGVVGLGINDLMIYSSVHALAAPLWLAKISAAAMTFVFNFGMRKKGLFQS